MHLETNSITSTFKKLEAFHTNQQTSNSNYEVCILQTISDIRNLPKLPNYVDGHTDIIIGVKYLRYYPENIFQLPSGLFITKITNKEFVIARSLDVFIRTINLSSSNNTISIKSI